MQDSNLIHRPFSQSAFSSVSALGYTLLLYCKVWDLGSKSLLTTFQFPQPIACLAWDLTERMFFAASSDGSIHQMNLFRQRDDKSGGQAVEAIGGAGVNDVIRVDDDPEAKKKRLISIEYIPLGLSAFQDSLFLL